MTKHLISEFEYISWPDLSFEKDASPQKDDSDEDEDTGLKYPEYKYKHH